MYDDEYDDTYDSMGINNTGADFKLVDDIDANADVRHTIGRAQMVFIVLVVLVSQLNGYGTNRHFITLIANRSIH